MIGRRFKFCAQFWILRGDARRTGVEMTGTRHNATHRNRGNRAERKFIGAHQRGDHYITSGAETAINAKADSAAQAAVDQRVLRVGETEFPRHACIFN